MTRLVGAPATTVDGWDVEIDASAQRDQDEEFLHLRRGRDCKRIRFHDYGELYDIPGLYDWVFYEALGCRSHYVVTAAVQRDLLGSGLLAADQTRALELGAGNGIVARELRRIGLRRILGVDILERARAAARRDSPGVYDSYLVADFDDLDAAARTEVARFAPNLLVSVAALGYGDIPVVSFVNAVRHLAPPAAVVFTVKREFLQPPPAGKSRADGYDALLFGDDPLLAQITRRSFVHRASSTGQELVYECVVAQRRDRTAASQQAG